MTIDLPPEPQLERPDEPVETPVITEMSYELAPLGAILFTPVGTDIPDGWVECLADVYYWTNAYPDFRDELGITTTTFSTPVPERLLPGQRAIMKVGRFIPRRISGGVEEDVLEDDDADPTKPVAE